MKLTLEEKDALQDLAQHSGVKVLAKLLSALTDELADSVLKYDLGSGSDRTLAILKAEADGAKKLVRRLETHINTLKPRQKV